MSVLVVKLATLYCGDREMEMWWLCVRLCTVRLWGQYTQLCLATGVAGGPVSLQARIVVLGSLAHPIAHGQAMT